MTQNIQDERLTGMVQSSTRVLMESFRTKTKLLAKSSDDIKLLLREGYNVGVAKETAEKFFGKEKVSFIAIDGTESQDQQLDMLIFYAGAFGYTGEIEFTENGCICGDILKGNNISNVSAAIPINEEDASDIVGYVTEGGIEVDAERLPSTLMQFAEYYMAVKALHDNPDLKVILLDRTLAGDVSHLIWSVTELLNENKCVLMGMKTEFGIVSALDLELSRMLHPNERLQIPAPRSQFIKYAAINRLLKSIDEEGKCTPINYEELLNTIGANKYRLRKLVNDLTKFNEFYSFLTVEDIAGGKNGITIEGSTKNYWQRVFSAVMKLAEDIFDPSPGKHPLIFEYPITHRNGLDDLSEDIKKKKRWITSADLEYMTLVMIYALIRLAWERNVLIIGLIKDTGAAELTKTVVPILRSAGKLKMLKELPRFNSDKQLLQTSSVVNGELVKAPWRTFEFDACFRTMVPILQSDHDQENLPKNSHKRLRVKGAFKNIISPERMFLKSYIQLWQSQNDHNVRSHVFSYDRPCYPDLDTPGELLLFHDDDRVEEEIRPMIHIDNDSGISHLVMDILCSMSLEVIPECLGHNYPLFLADKKAKYILGEMKTAYLATVAFEMTNSDFDQQVLYGARFRDFRSEMEKSRRARR